MAIDFDTPVGRVRLLTADFDEAAPILTDAHITAYLTMNAGSEYRASADALDAMATSESLLSKAIRTQDLTVDGTKVAADLRKRAETLRAKADAADAADAAAADDPFFEIVSVHGSSKPEGAEWRW